MLPLTHEQAIDQLRKLEQLWVPDEMEDWPLEGIEQFITRTKEILRAVPVKVLTAVLLLFVLPVDVSNPLVNSGGSLSPSPRINPLRGNGVQVGLPNVPGVAR
jgi:hypothetical protein